MSLSAKFRHSIKPLIIMNSIFTTGLVEYFVNDNINAIGTVYAFFSLIFYILIASTLPFSTQISFRDERPLLIRLTRQLHIYSAYVFYIINIIAGILRRKKVRRFMLQIETCVRTMDQLNIPMNSSKCFWQQCYLILFLYRIIDG
ncbi:gustatory and pheromone receptor 32a-like [Vespula maculifrons]|uniref:Gustatory and pheromone receptor 32a-like n=1 Tax=Vespula maculifrons TaxID=7453 RepID=A0ABD2CNV9_VESMC